MNVEEDEQAVLLHIHGKNHRFEKLLRGQISRTFSSFTINSETSFILHTSLPLSVFTCQQHAAYNALSNRILYTKDDSRKRRGRYRPFSRIKCT